MRVQEGLHGLEVVIEGVEDVVCGHGDRQRQVAGGQALGEAHEVRRDVGLLAGEEGAGAAEAHGDLVGDQVDVVAVAGLAQLFQVDRVVHPHVAGALDQGLNDDGADVVRVLGHQRFHVLELAQGVVFPAFTLLAVERVRGRRREHLHQQRLVGLAVQAHVAQRQRTQGLAVVAVGDVDEVLLRRLTRVAEIVVAHLERHLDGGGAVVRVKTAIQPLGCHIDQAFREVDHRFMGEAGKHGVFQLLGLLVDGLVDAWVGVAEQVHPPGADRVNVAVAVKVVEPDALAALERNQRQGFVVLHLGTGVPDGLQVTLDHLAVGCHDCLPVNRLQNHQWESDDTGRGPGMEGL